MIIRDFGTADGSGVRVSSATVTWEDADYPNHELYFEICSDGCPGAARAEPSADAFLAACFPLAAAHGERRVRIERQPCPMLVEGLYTAHAWWTSWGGMPAAMPVVETPDRSPSNRIEGPRRAVGFLSGGVDGLHMLMRNHRVFHAEDPAYIRDVLFIHGFDIGKRARDSENERYRKALDGLQPIIAEAGLRLIACRTNLRHLPSKPDFWEYRHVGAALAAVGHAATSGPAFLFIGGTYPVTNPAPTGSHAAVDNLFSTQRVTVIHDGSRFSRLEKVLELTSWPTALAALRVCPTGLDGRANCGKCEKCLRTRLELLAAGVEQSAAFGPSLTPCDLWHEAVPEPIGDRAVRYLDLLPHLRARGLDELCRVLEEKVADYRQKTEEPFT